MQDNSSCPALRQDDIHNDYTGVKNMNQNFMKEKTILPLVISMSLPMVISMAINSLYNIVDSYFVAKIVAPERTVDMMKSEIKRLQEMYL